VKLVGHGWAVRSGLRPSRTTLAAGKVWPCNLAAPLSIYTLTMHRRKLVGLVLLLCMVGGATFVSLHYWLITREANYRALRVMVDELHSELGRYWIDNDGDYPPDLETLLRKESIELPDNPIGEGAVKILSPADPWESGGLVYISWGQTVATESGPSHVREHYILVGYSARRQRSVREVVERHYAGVTGQPVETLPASVSQIAWEHVEVVRFPWYLNPGQQSFPRDF
jgi:hypothetical protein